MYIKLTLEFSGNTITLNAETDEEPIKHKWGYQYRNLDRRCIDLLRTVEVVFNGSEEAFALAEAAETEITKWRRDVLTRYAQHEGDSEVNAPVKSNDG